MVTLVEEKQVCFDLALLKTCHDVSRKVYYFIYFTKLRKLEIHIFDSQDVGVYDYHVRKARVLY